MALTYEGIDHVTLPVTYLKRSVEFYRDVLGLVPIDRPEQLPLKGVWFSVPGGQQVHLMYHVGWQNEGVSVHYHFALRVRDLSAAREQLSTTGWPIGDIEHLVDGTRRMFLKDPDGHMVELCQAMN